jgi:hypothetical protein
MRTTFGQNVVALALAISAACFAADIVSAQSPKLPNPAEAAKPPLQPQAPSTDGLPPEQAGAVPAPSTDLIAADPGEAPMPGLKRLSPDAKAWVDPKQKRVVIEGEIVLRQGPLELLACLRQTKEHEAIIACDTKAEYVHAALLALGAEPGNPARFQPEFTPARGTEIEITIEWKGPKGEKKSVDAREWIKHAKTGKQLDYPWVFGGSGFWKDPMTGKLDYQADYGDFICVSNFPTAMLDLPVESPQANAALMFEAFTERIPDEKTKVIMILTPKLAKAGDAKPAGEAKPGEAKPSGEQKPAASDTGKAAVKSPAKPAPSVSTPSLSGPAAVPSVAAAAAKAPAAKSATTAAATTPEDKSAPTATTPAPRPVTTQAPPRGPLRRLFRRP